MIPLKRTDTSWSNMFLLYLLDIMIGLKSLKDMHIETSLGSEKHYFIYLGNVSAPQHNMFD